MSQQAIKLQANEAVASYELREIAEILVKQNRLHEGIYDLAVEFHIGVGAVGGDSSSAVPGVLVGVKRIGLIKSAVQGATTVDAAEVNPAPKTKKRA